MKDLALFNLRKKICKQLKNIQSWFYSNNKQIQQPLNSNIKNSCHHFQKQQFVTIDNVKMYSLGYRSQHPDISPPIDRLKQYKIKQIIIPQKKIEIEGKSISKQTLLLSEPRKYKNVLQSLQSTSMNPTILDENKEDKQIGDEVEINQFQQINEQSKQQIIQQQKQQIIQQKQQGTNLNKLLVNENKKLYHKGQQIDQKQNMQLIENMTNNNTYKNYRNQLKQSTELQQITKENFKWTKIRTKLRKNKNSNLESLSLPKTNNFQQTYRKSNGNIFQRDNHINTKLNYQLQDILMRDKLIQMNKQQYKIYQNRPLKPIQSAIFCIDSYKQNIRNKKKQFYKTDNKRNNQISLNKQKKEKLKFQNLTEFDQRSKSLNLMKTVNLFSKNLNHYSKYEIQKNKLQYLIFGKKKITEKINTMTVCAQKRSTKFTELLTKYIPKNYNVSIRNEIKEFKEKLAMKKISIQQKKLYDSQKIVEIPTLQKIIQSGDHLLKRTKIKSQKTKKSK